MKERGTLIIEMLSSSTLAEFNKNKLSTKCVRVGSCANNFQFHMNCAQHNAKQMNKAVSLQQYKVYVKIALCILSIHWVNWSLSKFSEISTNEKKNNTIKVC